MQKQNNKIINACKKGNQRAQIKLYDLYCNAMYTVACRYLNHEDAKDAMQEGFLKAFSNIKRFETKSNFGAWLKRIIINTCIDVLRQQKTDFKELDTDYLELVDDSNWLVEDRINKSDILFAITQLKEKQKVVVKLYLIEGYDHTEISEILNIPVKTSRTNLRRGRLALQTLLKTSYNEARS